MTLLDAPTIVNTVTTESTLLEWSGELMGNVDHEERVADHAATLFDLTRHEHGLSASWRQMLRWAAVTHDAGRWLGEAGHAERGAMMILSDRSLPLRPRQRRVLACLAACHRGKVPALGHEPHLIPTDPRRAIRILLALLRAADGLDKRRRQPPHIRFWRFGECLNLTLVGPDAGRCFGKSKKFKLLTQMLKLEVQVVRERTAEPYRQAA